MLPVCLAPCESSTYEPSQGASGVSQAQPTTYLFFNAAATAPVTAAVARLIPADDQWAGHC